MFSAQWFFKLEKQLRDNGLDSDNQSFDEILENLQNRKIYPPDEFAYHCMYVILAGGFSQKTAKKIHQNIIDLIKTHGASFDILIKTFNNKKIRHIISFTNDVSDFLSAKACLVFYNSVGAVFISVDYATA